LVEKVRHWPGVDSFTAIERRTPLVASKPTRFFRQENEQLPDVVTLELVRPPGWEKMDHADWVALLRQRVTAVEAQAAAERAAKGTRIVGRRAVRKQRWWDRPSTREPRRELSPRLACRDKWRRIEAIRRNRAFIDAYRAARALFVAGVRVCFPAGTFWLARFACVERAPPG
jgi:putative transposase